MSWGGPGFVLAIIAISTFGWIVNTWIRARHGYPVEKEWSGLAHREDPDALRQAQLMEQENEKLRGQVLRLEERLAVLERIATDPAERTAREIEKLR